MPQPFRASQTRQSTVVDPADLMRRAQTQRTVSDLVRGTGFPPQPGGTSATGSDEPADLLLSRADEIPLEQLQAHCRYPWAVAADEWTQHGETAIPAGVFAAFELSDAERRRLIRSVVSSEAIEGVVLSPHLVSRLLDRVLLEPPVVLG